MQNYTEHPRRKLTMTFGSFEIIQGKNLLNALRVDKVLTRSCLWDSLIMIKCHWMIILAIHTTGYAK
jgi:hypothetical protein